MNGCFRRHSTKLTAKRFRQSDATNITITTQSRSVETLKKLSVSALLCAAPAASSLCGSIVCKPSPKSPGVRDLIYHHTSSGNSWLSAQCQLQNSTCPGVFGAAAPSVQCLCLEVSQMPKRSFLLQLPDTASQHEIRNEGQVLPAPKLALSQR